MWGFKTKSILIFIAIFLLLYTLLLLISSIILFKYAYLTTGEKIYADIIGLITYFPLNPLWNDGKWSIVLLLLNGAFWGFICYTIISLFKKRSVKHPMH
jgi:uncharacterized membrane protein